MQRFGLNLTYGEYLADAIIHVLGVATVLIGATALIVWASITAPWTHLPPLSIYAAGLIACFSLSAAYNMTLHSDLRALLRRFDHAAIFLMIAGTYTPVALIGIGGTWGVALTIAAWSIAVIGIILKLGFFHSLPRLGFVLYLAQGWLALAAIAPMLRSLSPTALILVGLGGIIFTLGTLFHHRDDWPYNRAIWHALVLAAAALHYSAVIAVAASP
jgi:hemolysin III